MRPLLWLLTLVILLAPARPSRAADRFVPLDLSPVYDNDGVATASDPNDGNFDAIGTTQPATFNFAAEGFPITPEPALAGVTFRLGPVTPGAKQNMVARGQRIPVPAGKYSALYILAACTNGSYSGTWTLQYDAGAPQKAPVRFSDWCTLPAAGEAVAIRTPYRYMIGGGKTPDAEPQLFVQRVLLDKERTLAAITLPEQLNTHVFALTLREGTPVEPASLKPPEKPETAGPSVSITSDAPIGAMVVSHGPVKITATATNLPAGNATLALTVTDPEGNPQMIETTGPARDGFAASVQLPKVAPGYYRIEAHLKVGGSEMIVPSGLAVIPENAAAWKADSVFGVNEGFDQDDPAVAKKRAWLVRRAGVRWVRQGFGWGEIQPEPDVWKWEKFDQAVRIAEVEKLRTLGLLAYWVGWSKPFTDEGYKAYADYAVKVATRYKSVPVFEVWNEPNIFYWKGTRDQYATLLKTATAAIHEANPKTKVAGLVTAFSDVPFIRGVLEAGARPDIVSIHPYRGGDPDEPSKLAQFDGGKDPHTMAEELRGVKSAISETAGPRPLWASEIGWWTGDEAKGVHGERFQANALAHTYVAALAEGVSKVFWYCFVDPGANPEYYEHHFGLLRPDLSPKPSYVAYATLSRLLEGATFEKHLDAGENIRAFRFRRGPEAITVAWSTSGRATARIPLAAGKSLRALTWDDRSLPVKPSGSTLSIPVDEAPVYIIQNVSTTRTGDS